MVLIRNLRRASARRSVLRARFVRTDMCHNMKSNPISPWRRSMRLAIICSRPIKGRAFRRTNTSSAVRRASQTDHVYERRRIRTSAVPEVVTRPPGRSSCSSIRPDSRTRVYPCSTGSLMDLLERKALTWRYYQAVSGSGIWNGPDAILHIRTSRGYAGHIAVPPSQVLTDIADRQLADVVWVTPTALASDHAEATNGSGPSWVASVVNAIGESKYWDTTVIFVTWDDWGGWYDHVPPKLYNSYELGFRVPLIVVSPYAKKHYVSHVQHEFGSILKFTEKIFGLPSLDTTDARSDDLFDCFDFSKPPSKFKRIPAEYPPSYFLKQPSTEPDD